MIRKRFEWSDLAYDTHTYKNCPNRYCRVHFYYEFDLGHHVPFPNAWNYLSSRRGWVSAMVHCGPSAWLPKKPTPDHLTDMSGHCPHEQIDLTCNYCLRHTFHPREL